MDKSQNEVLSTKWIDIKNQLPLHESLVIIVTRDSEILYDVLYTNYEDSIPGFYYERTDTIFTISEITHWIPALSLPSVENN